MSEYGFKDEYTRQFEATITDLQAQLATASQREKLTGDFYLDLQRIHQETLIELATARADAEEAWLAVEREARWWVLNGALAGAELTEGDSDDWREWLEDESKAALANHEALKAEASRSREAGE